MRSEANQGRLPGWHEGPRWRFSREELIEHMLTVQTWPCSGMTGTVVVEIGALRTEIPISVAAEHIIDIAFVHGGGFMDARIFWRPGMIDFVWKRGAMRRGLTAPGA